MNSAGRNHGERVLLPVAVLALALSAPAPAPAAGGRSAEDVRRSELRFETTGAGYRQAVLRISGLSSHEKDVLGDIRFEYERTPLPKVQALWQFGQRKITLSDGWLSLVEDLTRASAVADVTGNVQCFNAFAKAEIEATRHNLHQSERANPQTIAVPSFDEFVRAEAVRSCKDLRPLDLRNARVDNVVAVGINAAMVWVIGREFALELDPRDLDAPASLAAAASAALAASMASSEARASSPRGVIPVSEVRREAARLELRCRTEVAEARSIGRAAALHVDLLPAHAAVLIQAALFDTDGDSAPECKKGRERVQAFFQSIRELQEVSDATRTNFLEKRMLEAWPTTP